MKKQIKTTYEGFDGKSYAAMIEIEDGVVTRYDYFNGEIWIDTEERDQISAEQISELLE